MRTFKIPFDVSGEEKIFKGMLSLRQMAYMSLNLCTVGLLFIRIPLAIRIIVFIIIVSFVSVLSFLKINGIYFDKYLCYYSKYRKKNKKYLYTK